MEIKNPSHYTFEDKDLMSVIYKPKDRQMGIPIALGGSRSYLFILNSNVCQQQSSIQAYKEYIQDTWNSKENDRKGNIN